jgi:hypothetical protein
MSGWPDPDKPGVPLNQDVTGEHYIADSVALWFADLKKWAIIGGSKLQTPELLAGQSWAEYIGPCPTSAEADDLRAENARLREALVPLKLIADRYDDDGLDEARPSWGGCVPDEILMVQGRGGKAFLTLQQCFVARAALDADGQKERRAKALSDLAEMDADLLDIDPEMKP